MLIVNVYFFRFHFKIADKIKLTYFNFHGLGESIRYILGHVDADFEDVRITMDKWSQVKNTFSNKQLPILEVDGKTLCQSVAICRYLGQKYNLAIQDNYTSYLLEASIDHLRDIYKLFVTSMMSGTTEAKKEFEDKAANVFSLLEPAAADGYLYGKKPTWVDVYFTGYVEGINVYVPGLIKDYPNLVALTEKIKSKDSLSKYLKQRPELSLFKK